MSKHLSIRQLLKPLVAAAGRLGLGALTGCVSSAGRAEEGLQPRAYTPMIVNSPTPTASSSWCRPRRDHTRGGRARAFADWLTSDQYLDGHPNVFAFDFFDALAEGDPASPEANMLGAAYRPTPSTRIPTGPRTRRWGRSLPTP